MAVAVPAVAVLYASRVALPGLGIEDVFLLEGLKTEQLDVDSAERGKISGASVTTSGCTSGT